MADQKEPYSKQSFTDYNRDIDRAKMARDSQKNDTNPMVEKEGFLGMDDLDKIRRRKLK